MQKRIVVHSLDVEPATVTVEEFEGHVQILIDHAYATAAAVMSREESTQIIQAMQAQADELAWLEVDALVRQHFVGVTKWTAEYVPYDDGMVGGDWYILGVETEGGNVLTVGGDDDYERQTTVINNVLMDVWEDVLEGHATRTRTLGDA